jgi:hypothetical protein
LGKFTNKNCANLFSKIGHTRSLWHLIQEIFRTYR